MVFKILAAAAGVAAVTTAAPAAAAQYPSNYPYAQEGYPYQGQPHTSGNYRPGAFGQQTQQSAQGYPYWGHPHTSGNYRPGAFDYSLSPQVAAQMCGIAVQARLNDRSDLPAAVSRLVGTDGGSIVSVTQAVPKTGYVQVRGLASSDLFGPYGVGAYGALAYTANPNLDFRCTVTPRAGVTNVDISVRQ